MSNRAYVLLTLGICALLLAAAATVNIVVDPYSIFGSPRWSGFNSLKPHAGERGRTTKVHQVLQVRPRAVVTGNSRPEMGIDPEHACWPVQPVYNMAVPGLSFYRQIRYAQHATIGHEVELLLMGVDFVDFLDQSANRYDPALWPSPEESGLTLKYDAFGRERDRFRIETFVDRFRASVSLQALADSVTTVMAQSRDRVATRTESGFFPAEGLYLPIIDNEGVAALFIQKNRQIAERLATGMTFLDAGQQWSGEFEALRRFLEQRQGTGSETILFINPYHAEYMLMLDVAGYWDDFEQWKSMLVDLTQRFGVTLFDFGVFDDHATELIDAVAPRGESLQWFWEPSHYRREFGDKMLATMLADSCPRGGSGEIGVRLTRSNLARHLDTVRARRDTFMRRHGEIEERLRMLLRPASAHSASSNSRSVVSVPDDSVVVSPQAGTH